jgi:luciferase family oxidoreductase group 1
MMAVFAIQTGCDLFEREVRLLNPLKLSVLDLVPVFQDVEPYAALQQAVVLAQTAERLGYSRYWTSEHHDMEHLASTAPEVLIAHLGAHTKRIRLGSGAVLLPHYKPMKVAEVFHLLATLYPGRIDLGIGRAPGGSAQAVMALNDNFLEQIRQMPASLQALTKLLTNEFSMEGEPVIARPIPPIAPELWMLGTNRKSAKYAAEHGAGYVFGQFMSEHDPAEILSLYRDEFQPSTLSSEPRAIITVKVVCAETEEEAKRWADSGTRLFNKAVPLSEEGKAANARACIGTPKQVREKLLHMQQIYRVDEFMIITMVPDYRKRIHSYELLARSVVNQIDR